MTIPLDVSIGEASALLAAYNFYPDSYMTGTKPDPRELSILIGLMHAMEGVFQNHPALYMPVKHPRSLDELKKTHRVSYGMSRKRFMTVLSNLNTVATQLRTTVDKYETAQAVHAHRDMEMSFRHFLNEDAGDRD